MFENGYYDWNMQHILTKIIQFAEVDDSACISFNMRIFITRSNWLEIVSWNMRVFIFIRECKYVYCSIMLSVLHIFS